jgi:hypothetical protein
MAILGYIVQYSNEDDYTVYHGFVKLHRTFSSALDHAKDTYRGYLEQMDEAYDGPYETYSPSKKECDERGSVVIFRSREMVVWIDCVIE